MKIVFILLALGLSFNVYSFTGLWQGEGFSKTTRTERECDLIYFHFELNVDALMIHQGGYSCGILRAEYPPSRFERRGESELWYQGKKVGELKVDGFSLDVPEEFFRLDISLRDGQLETLELWDDGSSFLKVSGLLTKL